MVGGQRGTVAAGRPHDALPELNVLDAYRRLVGELGGDWSASRALAERWLAASVWPRWPHLRAELADGEAVVWCRSEVLGAAGLYGGECTGVVKTGVAMQTWDWHPSLAGALQAKVVRSAGGEPVLVAAEGSQPAKLGLSVHGVWVGLTWLLGSRPADVGVDVPIHVAVRVVLEEARTGAHAVDLLSGMPLAQAALFPVVGPDGAWIVERHPAAPAAVRQGGAFANHPCSVEVRAAQGKDPWRAESEARAAAVAAGGSLSAPGVAQVASADGAYAERVETLAAVEAHPAEGRFVLCQGAPVSGGPAVEHHLDGTVLPVQWGHA